METIIQASAVIIGLVNGLRLFTDGDKKGALLFGAAVVAGILFGSLHFFGLTVETGIVAALASSGLYRVGEKIGGK